MTNLPRALQKRAGSLVLCRVAGPVNASTPSMNRSHEMPKTSANQTEQVRRRRSPREDLRVEIIDGPEMMPEQFDEVARIFARMVIIDFERRQVHHGETRARPENDQDEVDWAVLNRGNIKWRSMNQN
jgi:hypothetical protein